MTTIHVPASYLEWMREDLLAQQEWARNDDDPDLERPAYLRFLARYLEKLPAGTRACRLELGTAELEWLGVTVDCDAERLAARMSLAATPAQRARVLELRCAAIAVATQLKCPCPALPRIATDPSPGRRVEPSVSGTQRLFAQSSYPMFIIDDDGRCVHVNSAGCVVLRAAREEVLALSLRGLAPPDLVSRYGSPLRNVAPTDK